MKLTLAVLLAGLCALAYSASVGGGDYEYKYKFDKVKLQYQKDLLTLFYHINQPSYFKEHIEIAKSYSIEGNVQGYTKPEVVEQFLHYYHYEYFLQRGEIFSVFYEKHLEQAIALFKLFYYAKDFQTFYKTAVWARQYVNEGLFLYSLSVAIVHRPDTYGVVLPPIYEIYPYYFYNSETINKAYYYKQIYGHHEESPQSQSGFDGYTIYSNYSGHYLNLHPEQSMSYYLEDVGINSFYYYYNIYYPYWMSGEEFNLKYDNRGEQYYFVYQQLLARYYLERLSHGFGEIEFFNWDLPFKTPYYPSLTYANGLEFPARPQFAHLYEYFYNYGQKWSWKSQYGYSYSYIHDYEHRIHDAIDKGYVYTHEGQKVDLYSKEGFNILGNLIESNPDSPDYKYYGPIQVFARHLLGYSYQPYDFHKLAPSALEHFETSLRDPAFYQFYKKIILYFQRYKYYLKPYSKDELYFPGVNVEKFEVDRLVTYFDYFDSSLSHAVYVTPEEFEKHSVHIQARQYRLNHKPFTYKVYVNSDKTTKAVVKVFLGPKYDQYHRYINITENRMNFVQLDHFVYDLKSGQNVITRNSHQSYFYGPDRTSYHDLYKHVMGAYQGNQDFHWDWKKSYFYFPQRYMLPKGTYDGYPYQFYVIVYPYVPYQHESTEYHYDYPKVGTGSQYIDGYALGYPFDRFIKYEKMFYHIPNAYFYETKIYHKHMNDVNVVQQ